MPAFSAYVRFELRGQDQLAQAIRQYDAATRRRLMKFIKETGQTVYQRSHRDAPQDTGELRRSMALGRLSTRTGLTGQKVVVGAHYGLWVELGTGDLRQDPKDAPRPPQEGARGTRAQPYVTPNVERMRPPFFERIQRILFEEAPRDIRTITPRGRRRG